MKIITTETTIKKILMTVGFYFFDEICIRLIFRLCLRSRRFELLSVKLTRDIITLFIFIVFIFYTKTVEKHDFRISFCKLFLAFFLVFIFLMMTGNAKQEVDPRTIFHALIFSPIIEEVISRKVVFSGLRESGHIVLGIIFSTLLFVSLHADFSITGLIYFTIMSFALMLIQLWTNSVINSILLHSFINFVILFIF
ncbi:CPBP family intramembrane glutamic endopeptidase [Lactobacillus sp. ESL0228]|uniref:CPBP family intramembrane glutamic endopeptidase n=1 Tax=Lactobacillus sp. ESL0228 TaxID=2069352 RepID=UPI000EFCCDB2|nr:CPBP family intramembrane glutamic endopeptidase [Lactobacillus sp. ESL0228]RMC48787.1 CPBP family intramembrane metalloprotease [Lactobacillus sp. ESL0228]